MFIFNYTHQNVLSTKSLSKTLTVREILEQFTWDLVLRKYKGIPVKKMYFGHRRILDKLVNDLVQLVEDVSPGQVDIPPAHGQMRQV